MFWLLQWLLVVVVVLVVVGCYDGCSGCQWLHWWDSLVVKLLSLKTDDVGSILTLITAPLEH